VVLEVTTMVLRRFGYRIVPMADPAEALERFHADPDAFDLLLLDQRLPGMTGLELLQTVRLVRPDTAAVISSGDDLEADVRRVGGRIAFAAKPIRAAALDKVLKSLLEG
jgi:CheY-like chemotaxis protein